MESIVITTEPGSAQQLRAELSTAVPGAHLRVIAPGILLGDDDDEIAACARRHHAVRAVHRDAPAWPLASTLLKPAAPTSLGAGVEVGGRELLLIAGPCAVEDGARMEAIAAGVVAAGAHALRGGVFKPRTSPYSFQGLGRAGLAVLAAIKRRHPRLLVATEVLDPREVEPVAAVADLLHIGARNMQNGPLLAAAAEAGRPVLLKRGFGNTADELLHSAEHLLSRGNPRVVLCERGVRTFEPSTRFTLDVGAVAWLKARTHLPVIVDPSHAAGVASLVAPLALAGIAAGADGLLVEVHDNPPASWSDAEQALSFAELESLVARLRPLAAALGRTLAPAKLDAHGRAVA